MSEVAMASLVRRVRGLHSLWREAIDTMDGAQVNHFERDGVLPIAFSVAHMARIEDGVVQFLLQSKAPIWTDGGWAAKTEVSVDDPGKELPVETMQTLRIGNWDAYRDYVRTVFDATDDWLARVDPARTTEELFGGVVPPMFQKAYVARVVGDGPITFLDGCECWIFQHGIRHLGECEHARALVGLGGMTS